MSRAQQWSDSARSSCFARHWSLRGRSARKAGPRPTQSSCAKRQGRTSSCARRGHDPDDNSPLARRRSYRQSARDGASLRRRACGNGVQFIILFTPGLTNPSAGAVQYQFAQIDQGASAGGTDTIVATSLATDASTFTLDAKCRLVDVYGNIGNPHGMCTGLCSLSSKHGRPGIL